nr:phosphatase PAP2 family protein [Pseudopedobacter sp.]
MQKKYPYLLLLTFLLVTQNVLAQNDSPYETSFKRDASLVIGGIGLSALGLSLIKNKKELTPAEVAVKSKQDVFFLDRFSAGTFREQADKDSYIPFYASFAVAPIIGLIDKNERHHYGQVSVLFIETMSAATASFTLAAGLVKRSRPLVYNTSLPLADRQDKDAQRSFFAGHTTATAAATFFAAKVYSDFNPDSQLKPYIWTAAALIPAVVAYQRIRAGKHFLSDNLLGYGVGMACGILIPELHKKKNTSLTVAPMMGLSYQGMGMTYTFSK